MALIYPEPLGPPRPVAGDLYFTVNDNIENGTNIALQLNTTSTKLHTLVNLMTTVNRRFTSKLIMLIQSPMIVDKPNNNAKAPPV